MRFRIAFRAALRSESPLLPAIVNVPDAALLAVADVQRTIGRLRHSIGTEGGIGRVHERCLAGPDFKSNWNGQSADDLFEKMQTSMPADQPGRLSREQNADILAFLFASNGFPVGQKELPANAAVLEKIRFESAKPK